MKQILRLRFQTRPSDTITVLTEGKSACHSVSFTSWTNGFHLIHWHLDCVRCPYHEFAEMVKIRLHPWLKRRNCRDTEVCFRVTWPQRTCPNPHCVSPYGLLIARFDISLYCHVSYILKVVKSYAFPLQHATLLFLSYASQLLNLGNLCMSQIVHWPSLLKNNIHWKFLPQLLYICEDIYQQIYGLCVFF